MGGGGEEMEKGMRVDVGVSGSGGYVDREGDGGKEMEIRVGTGRH